MFTTVAPRLAADRTGLLRELPVRPAASAARTFRGNGPIEDDGLDRYLADMVGAYGRSYDPEFLAKAQVTSYTTMASTVVAELTPGVDTLRRIVLAFATPDIDSRASAGCYLVEAAPGRPTVFCVSDQGVTAPFTALRLAADHLRDAAADARTALVVLDQRNLPWEVDATERVPAEDVAVAYAFRPTAPGETGVLLGQRTEVDPAAAAALLVDVLDEISARDGRPFALVAGYDVPVTAEVALRAERVHRVGRGTLCTGIWTTARQLTGRTVLAEYDPVLRYLTVLAWDPTW
ncbi:MULTISPECIES: hypothetical protein [unclassified Micromonospora]|uniref:hypothetical protein n=1 Tax=unclassified Micromonospora TaxID=2617518 RepID=UPI0010345B88|nr:MULTISPECIES: hypothetical protein [unclassified Micromonospora]QKW11544.1 hypothetical protein HUT12_01230 [Verrucosispora sp. NA02020]QKW11668.1 hypothetical protein HUT12_01935 [Verrucosispora sp. NA02020]TBL41988.1 hypothetical protein EYA84_05415 [Verrucosispora sp. SN26_14.1]